MKALLTTTAALSIGLTLGLSQPIQAQSPYSVPNGQEIQDPSLIIQQLEAKANSGKILTQEERDQIQDAMKQTRRRNGGMNAAPTVESAPTGDPSLAIQQLQTKANSGQKLTPQELRQLQSSVEEQENQRVQEQEQENERMRNAEESQRLTDEEDRQLQIKQFEGKRLTKQEFQQVQVLNKASKGERLTEQETQLLQSLQGATNRAPAIPGAATNSPTAPMRD